MYLYLSSQAESKNKIPAIINLDFFIYILYTLSMNTHTITKDFVLDMLDYVPASGLLLQRKKRPRIQVGSIAGVITPHGYRYIQLDGQKYAAHRLVWLIETGFFPEKHLDHIDGNKLNNCFTNLREVTVKQNSENKTAQKNNQLGVRGVCFNKRLGKYIAQIQHNGKNKHIGVFDTIEQAKDAYVEWTSKFFTHHNPSR